MEKGAGHNVKGNAAAEGDMEDRKDGQSPLVLAGLLAADLPVDIEFAKSLGFKRRAIGPYIEFCKLLKPGGLPCRPYLCLTTSEMKHQSHPHLLSKDGSGWMYCFPRKIMLRRELVKFIEAFEGR